jgi:nitrile hydratase
MCAAHDHATPQTAGIPSRVADRDRDTLLAVDGAHDMGGMHGFGAVVVPRSDDVFQAPWEKRAFAIQILVGIEGLGAGPGGRATREEMEPGEYLAASYYERWLWSAQRRLERRGNLAPGELERAVERLRAGADEARSSDPAQAARAVDALRESSSRLATPVAPRFSPGDRVRVRRMRPPRHTRCPRYVRGMTGVVERIQGEDVLPDVDNYEPNAPVEPVYAVAFRSDDLWGAGEEPPFTVLLDLWDSYLEPA